MTADRILVVDNEADIRRFIEVNLRLEGFEVVSAPDGEQGLAAAFEVDPNLVLLDVMMPGIDGIEVCRQLDGARTKVVMLTARDDAETRAAAEEAGADRYLTKPFSAVELLDAVRELLAADVA